MWRRFLDFIYPSLCEICGTGLKYGHALCAPCSKDLPRIHEPLCKTCGESFDGAIDDEFQCANCNDITFDFDFARAALKSRGEARQLIHDFKYRRRFYLARNFSPLLIEALNSDPRLSGFKENPIIIPVPLHWWRRQKRTANQAYEIAKHFSDETGYPLFDALKRQRNTLTQTRLTRKERLKNLRGAFILKPKLHQQLEGKTVLLIDDVFTTGATAHECAHILKNEAKVAQVIALTVLRG